MTRSTRTGRGSGRGSPFRFPPSRLDQTKPWGLGQQAPLSGIKRSGGEHRGSGQGGLGNTTRVAPPAPHMMMAFIAEFVVTPDTTYILVGMYDHYRHIFTDGRDWPKVRPTSPATRSASGSTRTAMAATTCSRSRPAASRDLALTTRPACLHFDNQSIFRAHLSRQGRSEILRGELTTIDNALTRHGPSTKNTCAIQIRVRTGPILHYRAQRAGRHRQ